MLLLSHNNNKQTKRTNMQTQDQKKLESLNRQLRISDVINILMTQSNKLLDIVTANQKEVLRLKTELDHLKEVA